MTTISESQVFIPIGHYAPKSININALTNLDGPKGIAVSQVLIITNAQKSLVCDATSLSAVSSNTTVVPLINISFSGTYPNCQITLFSSLNTGTSTITVSVKNEYNVSKSASFIFTAFQGPVMAFSFRKVVKAYSGSAMRVRRISDNVESDIGFDSNGNFDLATYNTFKGASTVSVKTWYDQSGNGYNATQTTNAAQPKITITGFNGAPQVEFGSSSTTAAYWMVTTQAQNVMTSNRDLTVFFAGKATTVGQNNYGSWNPGNSADRVSIHLNWSDDNIYWDSAGVCCSNSRISFANSANVNLPKVYVFGRNNGTQYIKINGTTVVSRTDATGTYGSGTTSWYLGATSAAANGTAPLAEYVQYLSGLTDAQVSAITNEQKNYFGL